MRIGIILETTDAERIWNAFRLANTALAADHDVDTFLLGNGVEAPDVETEAFNPTGLMRKYLNEGGVLVACGTCLESRRIEADDLRPQGTMGDLLSIIESADQVLTIG